MKLEDYMGTITEKLRALRTEHAKWVEENCYLGINSKTIKDKVLEEEWERLRYYIVAAFKIGYNTNQNEYPILIEWRKSSVEGMLCGYIHDVHIATIVDEDEEGSEITCRMYLPNSPSKTFGSIELAKEYADIRLGYKDVWRK